MENKFLEKVSEQIADERSRKLITAELESHLLDKIDYYTDIGYTKEEAEKRATEEMGNPDDTAVPLNALHNNKYRNLPTFICCGIIAILFICTLNLREWCIYSYDNMLYRHDILCDFVSVSFLITYAVLLIFAQKKNNKIIPLFVAISFVLQFASMLFYDDFNYAQSNMLYFYQPAMYALAKIFTEGFGAYSQCIFIEVPAKANSLTTFCFEVMPYILGIVFIVWSILLFIKILRMETITDYKGLKLPVRIIKICMSVFLAFNFAVMAVTAVSTATNDLITDNSYSKSFQVMSEYVLNADLTNENSVIFSDLESQGYYKYSETPNEKATYYSKGGSIELISETDVTGDFITISYGGTSFIPFYQRQGEFSDEYSAEYDETPETLANVDKIKKIKIGTPFDDIKKSGLLKYAGSIEKTYYKNSKKTEYTINLSINFKNEDNTEHNTNSYQKILTITEGKVTDYYD